MPNGSTSYEALLWEVNAWFRETQIIHESTVILKFEIMKDGKQIPHVSSMCNPTLRQMRSNVTAARTLTKSLWTVPESYQWCDQLSETETGKAVIPLFAQRQADRVPMKKRPARPVRKVTVFTLKRRGSLVVGGVKNKKKVTQGASMSMKRIRTKSKPVHISDTVNGSHGAALPCF